MEKLRVHPGFEGIYCKADLEYIIRILRKISDRIRQERDPDWAQLYIESFLLQNSRVYENLLKRLVRGVEKYYRLPKNRLYGKFGRLFERSLSYEYHKKRRMYRNTVAHATNYLRVTVLDFGRVLPRPINYKLTQSLGYNAMSKDLLDMWSADIALCADEMEKILASVISELNNADTRSEKNCHKQIEESILQFLDNIDI